jgi:hypothetical protein
LAEVAGQLGSGRLVARAARVDDLDAIEQGRDMAYSDVIREVIDEEGTAIWGLNLAVTPLAALMSGILFLGADMRALRAAHGIRRSYFFSRLPGLARWAAGQVPDRNPAELSARTAGHARRGLSARNGAARRDLPDCRSAAWQCTSTREPLWPGRSSWVHAGVPALPGARIVSEARRDGGVAVLDVCDGKPDRLRAVRQAVSRSARNLGARVLAGCAATAVAVRQASVGRVDLVVLTPDAPWSITKTAGWARILAEVTTLHEARAAAKASGLPGWVMLGAAGLRGAGCTYSGEGGRVDCR